MATQEIKIPVSEGTDFEFSAPLDGVLHNLAFQRNARLGTWALHLKDSGGNHLLGGAACVPDYDLLAHCGHEDRPLGQLILVDTAATGEPIGARDLGDRIKIVYVTADDD